VLFKAGVDDHHMNRAIVVVEQDRRQAFVESPSVL